MSQPPMTTVAPQPMSSPSNAPYFPPPPNQPESSSQQYSQYSQYPGQQQQQEQSRPQPRPQQQPYRQDGRPPSGQQSAPVPGQNIALHIGPENQIPDHPASMMDVRPGQTMTPMVATPAPVDLRTARTNCQFALREYIALQNRRQRIDASTSTVDLEMRVRNQGGIVLGDLRRLQSEVKALAKAGENHRWRKWFFGGGVAAFVPAVRKVFRRGSQDEDSQVSSNDTEYAFRRSKGLLSRIKDRMLGGGAWASIAFFVFAVLYVFQNEVSLRVARTVQKRIRKLCDKIERGDADVSDKDMKALEGWRWRVLLW